MPAVATMNPYTLVLREDEDMQNPRENMDNFGTMVCFHNRYNLGDTHDYATPHDYMQSLVSESVPTYVLMEALDNGMTKDVMINHNEDSNDWSEASSWEVSFYNERTGEYELGEDFAVEDGQDYNDVAEYVTQNLSYQDLCTLASYENIILPLYLYDHSGLSMSTDSFIGRAHHAEWDSGQVGCIHVTKENILKEYGLEAYALEPLPDDIRTKAENVLKGEVQYYDSYLRGECYGFELYENGSEIDSCWGFIGSLDELKSDIESHLPKECSGIMGNLDFDVSSVDLQDLLGRQELAAKKMEKPSVTDRLEKAKKEVAEIPKAEKSAPKKDGPEL